MPVPPPVMRAVLVVVPVLSVLIGDDQRDVLTRRPTMLTERARAPPRRACETVSPKASGGTDDGGPSRSCLREERVHVGGELAVVLEEESVRRVRVDLDPRVGE